MFSTLIIFGVEFLVHAFAVVAIVGPIALLAAILRA